MRRDITFTQVDILNIDIELFIEEYLDVCNLAIDEYNQKTMQLLKKHEI